MCKASTPKPQPLPTPQVQATPPPPAPVAEAPKVAETPSGRRQAKKRGTSALRIDLKMGGMGGNGGGGGASGLSIPR